MPRCSPTGSCGCAMKHVARLIEPVVVFLSRVCRVTGQGRAHLDEWLAVLDELSGSLNRLPGEARAFLSHQSLMEEPASR